EAALGGAPFANTIEGRRRFSIQVRLAEDFRNSLDRLNRIPLSSPDAGTIPLSAVADIKFVDGPPMITSENGILRGAVMFNIRDRDMGSTVQEAIDKINEELNLPKGYFIEWSGQYENLIRGEK